MSGSNNGGGNGLAVIGWVIIIAFVLFCFGSCSGESSTDRYHDAVNSGLNKMADGREDDMTNYEKAATDVFLKDLLEYD